MHFSDISFTPSVLRTQQQRGSDTRVQKRISGAQASDHFTDKERCFITDRDSFYLATVNETGWPYVQHRGGKTGFIQIIGPTRLAFADYQGNGEYLTLGNLAQDHRVAMILVDYPNRRRLKIFGRAHVVDMAELSDAAREPFVNEATDRLICIDLVAFDWNCSQFIWPRFREQELEKQLQPLRQRIQQLEAQLDLLNR
ncbi:pyridoxamine 5'-phosphate oxidase family protein [Pontibacter sp. JAM-7]|uniref:pyridoxamine 5'-phosphate oxidase family protein n=1 Tax=Pontibacter sp. JAM-7 TaxID=3366581 RepID=UPI003AF6AE40